MSDNETKYLGARGVVKICLDGGFRIGELRFGKETLVLKHNILLTENQQLEQKLAKAEAALKVYEEVVGNAIEAKTKIGTDLTLVYAQQKVKSLLGGEGWTK